MHQRLLLEEEQQRMKRQSEEELRRKREAEEEELRMKREAEAEELRRKREAEEEEFRLIRVREKQELHFQQQLEHAHLQAELNEAQAELSTEVSNIKLANQTKTNNNIWCKNGVNDKATNNHSAGHASLNAHECVKVKREASHFKTEHYVLSDNYAGAQVNGNELLSAQPNVKVSQSISVPVSCVVSKAVVDVNESCYNAALSLNPYSKPFESKTPCAYNTFASEPSNLKDERLLPPLAVGLSSGLVGSIRSVVQQPVLSGSHEVDNIVNTVSQSDLSGSSFTKLPTLKVEPPFFNGNSAGYFSFIKVFNVLIDRPLADPCRKLFFLLHYAKDIAHSLIKGCQHMPPERGYQEAKVLLQSYFGLKHKIIEACTRPIVKDPVLNEHDHRGLIKFSAEFTSCLITLKGMECLDRMDNMDMVTKIMHRLPPSWIPGWQYEVDQIMHIMHRDNF